MKIYVITKGEYSDYHICAVTDDPEKAAQMKRYYTDEYYCARVEEYDTDDDAPDLAMGDKMYLIRYGLSGDVECITQTSHYLDANPWEFVTDTNKYCVSVQADNEEAAIKIGAERRAKYLAEKMGL